MNLTETGRLVLERVDLFKGLSQNDFNTLTAYLQKKRVAGGSLLFQEGDLGDSAYVIRHGTVRVMRTIGGEAVELARGGRGDMVGETALIDSEPRFASAVCEQDSDLFVLTRESFARVFEEHPQIAARVLRLLAARIRETDCTHVVKLEIKNRDLESTRERLEQLLGQLRRSNEHLEAALAYRDRMLTVSPHPSVVTDAKNHIRLTNPAASRLFGHSSAKDLWSWITPVNPSDLDGIEDAMAQRRTWNGEMEILTEQQQSMICKLVVAPIADMGEGNDTRLWIFENLTEVRFLEQEALQREQLVMKGEMAAEIAHELNNYLAVLSGNAELLSMQMGDTVPEPVKRRLDGMSAAIERVKVFTDNMLHSRHPGQQMTSIDLNAFLESQIAFLKPQKRIKKMTIETDLSPVLPSLFCDPSAIQQVFYNLMLNAADSLTATGGERHTVSIQTSFMADTNEIKLVVSDDGPGIPPDVLGSLFKERVSSKPTGHGFGTLTIARLVQEHGGTVLAANRPDGGAEFTVLLPVREAIE